MKYNVLMVSHKYFFLKINNIREHIAKIQPKTRFCTWLLTFLAAFFHFFFLKSHQINEKISFQFYFPCKHFSYNQIFFGVSYNFNP